MATAKILIVDDEEKFCAYLAKALQKEGFATSTAHNPSQALEAIHNEKPDLVTLDMMMPGDSQMPGANGLGVLVQTRKSDKLLPIILISAAELAEDKDSFLAMGANAVHHKPIDLAALLATIRRLLTANGK
ncbi:MAG: response regulator transcription factor [Nitrospinae bacterium]|nr:response regulator transcription factor [Nitrospinota bacterium]